MSLKIIKKRFKIIELWKHYQKTKKGKDRKEGFLKKWTVSERTIQHWRRAYREKGTERLNLFYSRKGQKSKFDLEFLKLIEVYRKIFLKRNKTQESAYEDLEKACRKKGLTPPSRKTFEYYIYKDTTASERGLITKGRCYQQTHFTAFLTSFIQTIMPMQVLQIDNASYSVFPVDGEYRLPIGTPNITAAIDCYSRMISGFYLTLASCSSLTILEILVQSILPKEYSEKTYNTHIPKL